MAYAPVDPTTVPQLQGMFAPVVDEVDGPLEVVQGAIPGDLAGAYLRNGPNPRFDPIGGYVYPIDGDGMVHGVWFEDGAARYRNRFVRTPAIAAEEAAGHALWPSVMTGGRPTADEVGPELAATDRDLVDIHVVRHAGRLLALAESARPFQVDDDLATVGPWDFGGGLPRGICAHPRIDPTTGEMVVFRYDLDAPFLTWAMVGADGAVARPEAELPVDGSYMVHDCTITAHHLVLFVCPLRFDLEAVLRGGSLLSWEPERGTRILVVPRDGSPVRTFEVEPFWVWHFANAYEADPDRIVVDYGRWSHPGFAVHDLPVEAHVERATLHLDSGVADLEVVDAEMVEFARIDDRLTGQPHRFFHVAGKDPDAPPAVAGEWNRLLRYDRTTGEVAERRGGPLRFGEAVFAPRTGSTGEDDGYLLTYQCDPAAATSDLVVLDVQDLGGDPVATLRTPQRVPFGLHGSWLAAG